MHAVLVAGQPQQPQRVRERRPCCRHPGLRATPGCYRSARGPARSSARPCDPSHTSWQFNGATGHMVASLLEPPKPMRHLPLREHLVKSSCGSWGEPRRARECTLAAPPDPRPLQAGTAGQIQSMHRRGPAPCMQHAICSISPLAVAQRLFTTSSDAAEWRHAAPIAPAAQAGLAVCPHWAEAAHCAVVFICMPVRAAAAWRFVVFTPGLRWSPGHGQSR